MVKKKKRKLNIFRVLILAFLLIAFVGVGVSAGFVVGVVKNLPDLDSDSLVPEATTFIHDKDGKQVASLHGVENRIPVKLADVPSDLKNAFIAAEDRSFYKHPGVNPSSFVRAAIANARAGRIVQGGSTITMQLVDNAFFMEQKQKHSYKRKIQEALLSIQLERRYTKDEIFEAYLNHIYFGHGAYGVQAAAQTYFGKDVGDLTLGEMATVTGATNNPALYSPFRNEEMARNRRAVVLNHMVDCGYISSEEAEKAKNEEFNLTELKQKSSKKHPYYIDAVILEGEKLLKDKGMNPADIYRGGLHIYTALNTSVQNTMEQIYSDPKNFPQSPDSTPVQSSMVVLDPATGEIVGLIGGREHTVERGFNRAVQGSRQPGSAIKPLSVYAPALENGFTAATVIDDVPISYPQPGGKSYSPGNYDGRYRGLITMREAVRLSVNIPAVKLLESMGVEKGYDFARKLGLPLVPADKSLSLALGGLTKGVSTVDLASAYGAFANKGILMEPHTITKITDSKGETLIEVEADQKVIMSEQTAYIMTNILETVVNSGTGTNARMAGWPVAGKTGTTQLPDQPAYKGLKGVRDAWFVGYTPELVGVVWLGYDKTTPKHYLRGVSGGGSAAPIWKKVMTSALKGKPARSFPKPEGITWASVDSKSGKLPSEYTPKNYIINEIFAAGTIPKEISDVWVQKEVCSESSRLPADTCPEIISKVFLKRPIPYGGSAVPEDAHLELPRETCSLHAGGNIVTLRICMDPAHGGEIYLANIAEGHQSGGCPPHYVIEESFSTENAPKEYCNLPEHRLSVSNSSGSENTPPPPSLSGESQQGGGGPQVNLNWQMPAYSGEVVFSIERWTNENSTKNNIAVTAKTTWTDKTVQNGITYHYRVTALDAKTRKGSSSNNISIPVQ